MSANVGKTAPVFETQSEGAPKRIARRLFGMAHRRLLTPLNVRKNGARKARKLEIGSAGDRIDGFETLDVIAGRNVDYVADAHKLPFADGTFEVVYASHVLEHFPWYHSQDVISEWSRVLAPGGKLEIWVPDGLKIARTFVEAEESGQPKHEADGWWRFNPMRDPCVWMSGRTFSYGDGTGRPGHPNWHMSMFSERRLRDLMKQAGLRGVRRLDHDEVRGFDHGWINLGIQGSRLA